MSRKEIDVIVIIALLFLSIILSYITKSTSFGNVTTFSIIFAVPPTIYLGLRSIKDWGKILISMLVFGVLFLFPFDLIAQYTRVWDTSSYLFPYYVAGVKLTLDNLIWGMLMTMYTITFYQHFMVNETKTSKLSSRLSYTVIISAVVISFILITFLKYPTFFSWRYPYLILGTLAIVPPLMLGFYRPTYLTKMSTITVFFFFFYFVQEILGVSYHYWTYPGNNYVGWINIGGIIFPFEELFFWMLFYTATLVSYYEIFINKSS